MLRNVLNYFLTCPLGTIPAGRELLQPDERDKITNKDPELEVTETQGQQMIQIGTIIT